MNFPGKPALAAGFSILMSMAMAVPAEAQAEPARTEVAAGYAAVPYLQDSSGNLPVGWFAGFAQYDEDRPFGFVLEAAGSYDTDSTRMYTVLGGLRVSPGRSHPVRPFGQVTTGAMVVGCCDELYPYFTVEPGGGVDFWLADRTALRASVSVPFIFADGGAARGLRVQAGVVVGL